MGNCRSTTNNKDGSIPTASPNHQECKECNAGSKPLNFDAKEAEFRPQRLFNETTRSSISQVNNSNKNNTTNNIGSATTGHNNTKNVSTSMEDNKNHETDDETIDFDSEIDPALYFILELLGHASSNNKNSNNNNGSDDADNQSLSFSAQIVSDVEIAFQKEPPEMDDESLEMDDESIDSALYSVIRQFLGDNDDWSDSFSYDNSDSEEDIVFHNKNHLDKQAQKEKNTIINNNNDSATTTLPWQEKSDLAPVFPPTTWILPLLSSIEGWRSLDQAIHSYLCPYDRNDADEDPYFPPTPKLPAQPSAKKPDLTNLPQNQDERIHWQSTQQDYFAWVSCQSIGKQQVKHLVLRQFNTSWDMWEEWIGINPQ